MAHIPAAQETVLEIALSIPETENSRVHEDLTDIARWLPPSVSLKLLPQICAAITNSIKLQLAEKIGRLIAHLANGNEGQAALRLAGNALALVPAQGSDYSYLSDEAQAHFQIWNYRKIVEIAVPDLAKCTGIDAVRFCCSLLDQSIRLSRRWQEDEKTEHFYLRPTTHKRRIADDFPSILLCATRAATAHLITSEPAQCSAIAAVFHEHSWVSFRRLELCLALMSGQQGLQLTERIFQDPAILKTQSLRYEAILLLKGAFSLLTPETQEHVLQWIDAGPPSETVRSWLEFIGWKVTDDGIRDKADRWRRDHLSILEGQLPASYQHTYEDLKARLGSPNPPEKFTNAGGGTEPPNYTLIGRSKHLSDEAVRRCSEREMPVREWLLLTEHVRVCEECWDRIRAAVPTQF